MSFGKKFKIIKSDSILTNSKCSMIRLYRIKALRDIVLLNGETISAGMLGGYIQREENLSQQGTCWIGSGSKVYGNSHVMDSSIVDDSEVIDSEIFGGSKISDSGINCSVIEQSNIENSSIYSSNIYDCVMNNGAFVEYARIESSVLLNNARLVCDDSSKPNIIKAKKAKFSNCFLSDGARIKSDSDYVNIKAYGVGITVYKNKDNLSDYCGEYMYCLKMDKNISYGLTTDFESALHKHTSILTPMIGCISELVFDAVKLIRQVEKEKANKREKDDFNLLISNAMKSLYEKDIENVAEDIVEIALDYVPRKEVRNNDEKIQKVQTSEE